MDPSLRWGDAQGLRDYIPTRAGHSIDEMSERARDVFRLVVEAYLDSGQPVGSRTISRI